MSLRYPLITFNQDSKHGGWYCAWCFTSIHD